MEEELVELTAENVQKVFFDCMFTEEEIEANTGEMPKNATTVEGIVSNFGFNTSRVWDNVDFIKDFIAQLDPKFKDGWSFMNMVVTKDGVQWGEQKNAEQLLVLGLAIKKIKYMVPRDQWNVLPGGMPYITVVKG